jgi:hypothetical protein
VNETELLAMLLQNKLARKLFAESTEQFVQQYQIALNLVAFLERLDVFQLERQAELLQNKRLHEIRHLAPRTLKCLNDRAGELFEKTVAASFPIGSDRHWIDAQQFLKSLQHLGESIDQREINRIDFRLSGKRVCFRILTPTTHHGWGGHLLFRYKGDLKQCGYCLSSKSR